jgi:hypothetical protein
MCKKCEEAEKKIVELLGDEGRMQIDFMDAICSAGAEIYGEEPEEDERAAMVITLLCAARGLLVGERKGKVKVNEKLFSECLRIAKAGINAETSRSMQVVSNSDPSMN